MTRLERVNPGAAHWSEQQYENMFKIEAGASLCEHFALVVDAEPVATGEGGAPEPQGLPGFLVAQRVDREWELQNLVVAEEARRRGVGTLLISELIKRARAQQGSGIFLEVRESNQSARAFYKNQAFEEIGVRKGYYSNPTEDAILCRLSLY